MTNMKKKQKNIVIGILTIIIVSILILIFVNIVNNRDNKRNSVETTPTPTITPSSSSIEKITNSEEALQVIEQSYHEDGYEFKVKSANETEIVIEKINVKTNQVDSEFLIDIKEQTIINSKTETSTITRNIE